MNNKKLTTSVVASLILATSIYSNELSTITVTSATKSEQSIQDVTSNVDVLTSQEIEERGFTTVPQALDSMSGVIVSSSGGIGQRSSVYLRGFDANKTLVLIDGIRYNDSTSSGSTPMLEHLMINNIEKIEVVKGAQSGIWGADASAGVINIITKTPKKGIHGQIAIEGGSNKTKKVSGIISYSDKNLDLSFSALKLTTDGISVYSTPGEDIDKFEKDSYKNESIGIKTAYKIDDNNKIGLDYNQIIADIEGDQNNVSPNTIYDSKIKEKFSRVYLENKLDNLKLYSYVNYSDFNRQYLNALSGNEFDGNVLDTGINLNYGYLKDSFFTVGLGYTKYKNEKVTKNSYNNKSIFLTNSNSFNDGSTILTSSLRYDKSDKFSNETTGKVGIKHNFTKDLYITSNIGKGFNIPTLYQLYTPAITYSYLGTIYTSKVGNENLETEKTTSYDISFGYKSFKSTFFYNEIKNLIEYVDGTVGFNNIEGKSKIRGIEFSYIQDLTDDLLLKLDYTYIDARESDNTRLSRRPYNKFGFSVDYYGINKLHLNLNGTYTGTMKDRKYNPDYTYSNVDNGNFTIFNTSATYKLNNNFDVFLKIDNLTNKKYQMVYNSSSDERTAYAGIRYSF